MTIDNAKTRVLIVDDDRSAAELLCDLMQKRGFQAEAVVSGHECLERLRHDAIDVVVTDVRMPMMSGIELCDWITKRHPDCTAIVITAHGELDVAVQAMRAGAYDFITKPVRSEVLELAILRALERFALRREVKRLDPTMSNEPLDGLLGESTVIRELAHMIRRIARSDVPVLITGESGSGKEVIARALHKLSRADQPFVAINCGAMPAALLESELFGHVKGAFTDASTSRDGLFTQAGAGTILLDEIGELPLELQAKLLRVLQQRTVRQVGSDEERGFDARVITATNRDLETEVDEQRFREDLFHRINVLPIRVPALRARSGDVLVLANAFIARTVARTGKRVESISRRAAQLMIDYDWPGNVRELENCVERAVALSRTFEIDVEDLPDRIVDYKSPRIVISMDSPSKLVSMDELRHRYARQVLAAVGGNKTRAAGILGIDRRSLYRRLEPPKPSEP
jgi:two-component system response regulator HydG